MPQDRARNARCLGKAVMIFTSILLVVFGPREPGACPGGERRFDIGLFTYFLSAPSQLSHMSSARLCDSANSIFKAPLPRGLSFRMCQ